MDTVLRTLKVRLVADLADYTGPMAAAQAQAAALKAQLQTMFSGLGGLSAAGVQQLLSPVEKMSSQIGRLSTRVDAAYKAIGQGAVQAQQHVQALADTQTRMLQQAAAAASQLRALPLPGAPAAPAASSAPIGPASMPGGPQIAGPSPAGLGTAAAAAAGVRSTDMMQSPTGGAFHGANPIWRRWQAQLEEEAYRQGPGTAAWNDYQEARRLGGLAPAVWAGSRELVPSMSRAMQRGRVISDEAFGPPTPTYHDDLAEAERLNAENDLRHTAAKRAKLDADAAFRQARRQLDEVRHKMVLHRPNGINATGKVNPATQSLYADKYKYANWKGKLPGAEAAYDAAREAKAAADAEYRDARAGAETASAGLDRVRGKVEAMAGARQRALAVRARELELDEVAHKRSQDEHRQRLQQIEQEEALRVRKHDAETRRVAEEEAARQRGHAAERARLANGGAGGVPPIGPTTAAAAAAGAAGGNVPATIGQMADDAERMRGGFEGTRAAWRELVSLAGGQGRALGMLFSQAGEGMTRVGNRMVQNGTRWSTRYSMGIGLAGGVMLDQAGDFEAAMAAVRVYARDAGATTQQVSQLADKARDLGRTTNFSAAEVADAMREMLAAGFSVKDVYDRIEKAVTESQKGKSVLDFAADEGLTDSLREVRDLSRELEEARLGTFKGQLQEVTGAFNELAIMIGKSGLLTFAKDVAAGLTTMIDGLSRADPALLNTMTAVGGLLAVIGPGLAVAGTLIWSIGQVATAIGPLISILAGPVGLAAAIGIAVLAIDGLVKGNQDVVGALRTGNQALDDYNDMQEAITEDSALLEQAYRRQAEALASQSKGATDAADAEVSAIKARIAKNRELAETYKAIAEAQLAEAESRDRNADKQDRFRLMKLTEQMPQLAKTGVTNYWESYTGPRLNVNEGNLDKVVAVARAEAVRARAAGETLTSAQLELLQIIATMGERDIEIDGFRERVTALDEIAKKATDVSTATATAWRTSTDSLAKIEELMGEARSRGHPALEQLEDVHGKAVQLLDAIDDPLKMTSEQAKALTEDMTALASAAQFMAERINFWLMQGLEPGVAANKAHAEAVAQAWYKTYDEVVGHSYVPDMIDEIGHQFSRLDEVAVAPAAAAASKVSGIFSALGEGAREIFQAIGSGLRGAWSGLLNGSAPNSAQLLRSIGGGLVNKGWNQLGDNVFSTFGDLFKGWSGATKGEKGWVENTSGAWWQTALSWIGDLFGGHRANGGPTFPGRIYEVGEFGREKFIPSEPGTILNRRQLAALGVDGQGGGGVVINSPITINGNMDNVSLAQLQQVIDANNRMWASKFSAGVNATLLENRRQQRRI